MDMVKIGRFLGQLRKEQGLTQEQLGDKLGVTNKTVSRWETGNYLPPVEALQQLSGLYGISINELLSGQRLADSEYRQMAEENIKAALEDRFTLKEKIAFYRNKWETDHFLDNLLLMFPTVGLLIWGGVADKVYLVLLGVLYGFAMILIRRNAMMAYVEDHAFDGTGKH